MTGAEVRYDEAHEQYELGAEIDGAFVPFATVTKATVETAQRAAENAKENEQQQ